MTYSEQATIVQAVFGQRLVAFGCGVRSPRLVGRWARGEDVPDAEAATRLHCLVQWLTELRLEDDKTIRALSMGAWPSLNDEAPIEVIRNGEGQRALAAARAFDL